MARRKCGIESCDELAEFIDDMDNYDFIIGVAKV